MAAVLKALLQKVTFRAATSFSTDGVRISYLAHWKGLIYYYNMECSYVGLSLILTLIIGDDELGTH